MTDCKDFCFVSFCFVFVGFLFCLLVCYVLLFVGLLFVGLFCFVFYHGNKNPSLSSLDRVGVITNGIVRGRRRHQRQRTVS